ncbi:N-acetyltransferase eso1 [Thecaphora frezii]
MSSSPTKAGPSSEAYTHNPFDYVPKLQPPPQDRPIPSHTNLEVQPHVNGPPPWPTITYRHLLSAGTLNPANPLRVIAHCDVDAAYAQFEASRLGLDATKVPIAVQQWQGLIAVNYPARDAGISRFESIPEALKKCPELRLVHVATYAHGSNQAGYHDDPKPETHKVSLDPYRKESNKILAIFKRTCPSGAVEKASIDESYFDLTVEVRKLMVERFPHLKQVPPDDAESGIKGMDRPLPPPPRIGLKQWQKLGHVIPKTGEVGKSTGIGRPDKEAAKAALLVDAPVGAGHVGVEGEVNGEAAAPPHASWGTDSVDGVTDPTSSQPEELSEEEALWDRLEYGETTWTDVALALGAELMNRVRANVVEELGYTTSAGIGSNKTLSKLCSSWRKPNGQTILRPCSVANFFAKLPFTRIRFLGGKLGTAMAQEWGEGAMVADLWSVSLEEMQAKFGEEARWVYNVLRGVDHSEVRERVNNQTMLASKSVRPPITRGEEAVHWLRILATELAVRLQEARNERTNLWPKTLVLRYIRAGSVPRSRQVAFPYFTWKDNEQLAAVVLKKGEKLWLECVGDALQGTVAGGGGRVLTIALGFNQARTGARPTTRNDAIVVHHNTDDAHEEKAKDDDDHHHHDDYYQAG